MLKTLAILEVVYLLVLGGWIILERRQPLATVSWLLALAALPGVGLLIYYLLGPRRLHRTRARKQRMYQTLSESLEKLPASLLGVAATVEASSCDSEGQSSSPALGGSLSSSDPKSASSSQHSQESGSGSESESESESKSECRSQPKPKPASEACSEFESGNDSGFPEPNSSSPPEFSHAQDFQPFSRLSGAQGGLLLSRSGKEAKKTRWEMLWAVPGAGELLRGGEHAFGSGAFRELITLAKSNSAAPLSTGNTLKLLRSGADKFPALEEAIRGAQRYIHLQYYIYEPDDCGRWLRDLLVEKAREGVKIRLLVDAVGSRRLSRTFLSPLLAVGAEVAFFNPVRFARLRVALNFRNHRKIVLVDGKLGFTGGLNIGNEYRENEGSSAFRDTHLQISGPAVAALARVFVEDWYWATGHSAIEIHYEAIRQSGLTLAPPLASRSPEPGWSASGSAPKSGHEPGNGRQKSSPGELVPSSSTGGEAQELVQIIHSGPDMEWKSVHQFYFSAITQAKRRVWLTAAYFVPDEPLLCALITASLRGLEVVLLLPSHSDSKIVWWAGRSFYQELLAAGVRIFEYQPAILHAKTAVIDSELGLVGTANLDPRSFALNWEVVVACYGALFAAELEAMFEQDLAEAREVFPGHEKEQSFASRLAEASARVLSPLL